MSNKEMINGEGQRKEVYYVRWAAGGGGKVSISAHLWNRNVNFRFTQTKDLG
jgi:hypothetical protein